MARLVVAALLSFVASADVLTPGGTDEITFPVTVWKMNGAKYTLSKLNQLGTDPLQLSGGKHWDQRTTADNFNLPAGCYSLETVTVAEPGMNHSSFSWNITGANLTGGVFDTAFFGIGGAFCDLSSDYSGCFEKRSNDSLTCRNYPSVLLETCGYKVTDSRYTAIKAQCVADGEPAATTGWDLQMSLVFDTFVDTTQTRKALLKEIAQFLYMGTDTSRLEIASIGPIDSHNSASPIRVLVTIHADGQGNYANYLAQLKADDAMTTLNALLYGTDSQGNENVPGLDGTTMLGMGAVEDGAVPIDPATQKLLDELAANQKSEAEVIKEINNKIKKENGQATDDDDATADDDAAAKNSDGSSSGSGGLSGGAIAGICAGAAVLVAGGGGALYVVRRRKRNNAGLPVSKV